MKKYLSLYLIAVLSIASLFSSCKKDKEDDVSPQPTNPTAGLTLLSEGYAIGAGTKVEVWSKKAYTTGYNKLFIYLKDSVSGNGLNSASISLNPMMDMGTMTHSSPFENPEYNTSSDGIYPCAVVFTMSSMGGTWTIDVSLDNLPNGKSGTASFSVMVNDPVKSTIKSFISLVSSETLFVALIKPENPAVGLNDLEVAVYKKGPMGMSWPADSSMTIEIEPLMVSMGHGSPNNVDPVHITKGHYKGVVNYTMSGDWRINFSFYSGSSVANNSLFFEMDIP